MPSTDRRSAARVPQTWYAWRKQTPPFAEHYLLIVPDLRGYGATDKPPIG
jgi:pimeloyl-ACP methyl ester carboxylesterase